MSRSGSNNSKDVSHFISCPATVRSFAELQQNNLVPKLCSRTACHLSHNASCYILFLEMGYGTMIILNRASKARDWTCSLPCTTFFTRTQSIIPTSICKIYYEWHPNTLGGCPTPILEERCGLYLPTSTGAADTNLPTASHGPRPARFELRGTQVDARHARLPPISRASHPHAYTLERYRSAQRCTRVACTMRRTSGECSTMRMDQQSG
jgi:hypothetical protein